MMLLRSNRIIGSRSSSSYRRKKTPSTEPKKVAPCAPLSEFKVSVPNFDEVAALVVTIPPPPPLVVTIPPPPPPVVTTSPPPPPLVVTIPPPPPQDDDEVWWKQTSFYQSDVGKKPPSPSESELSDTIELSTRTVDGLCENLQYYSWPGVYKPVRTYRKYWANSPLYTLPEVVMRKWLSFVIEAGMPWTNVLKQIPIAQRNLARKIMLELHAQF
jgi:hypothetical protein